jgi:hypothetical protein
MCFDVDINFDGLGEAEARRRGVILSAGGVNPSACNSTKITLFLLLFPLLHPFTCSLYNQCIHKLGPRPAGWLNIRVFTSSTFKCYTGSLVPWLHNYTLPLGTWSLSENVYHLPGFCVL